ncbi:thioredoxin family protein [Thalassotalea nanhaiensis]|uniref:Thioredoxin family protein n=1 Tax=Thalassotalea nanhaiensis TaxID=3065648 RepID=A0ABY9THH5_9GAMM|nr:thioredoxin family protein [Colwelliaceae bacterium SQ345]
MNKTIQQSIIIFLTSIIFISFVSNAADGELPLYSKVYDEQRDPFKDAMAAITLAEQTDRNVLIEIGGDWCTWCHKIDDFLAANPDIYEALHANFVLLKVSVSDANENLKFMSGLPPVLGYPHMYVSTGKGKVILSKDTAEFLVMEDYSRQKWLEFIDTWKAANNNQNIATQNAINSAAKASADQG